MSLKWNSDREKFLADPEVAEYYQELDAEFEVAKQVAREKRMKIKDINSMTHQQLAEYYYQLNLVLHPDSTSMVTKTICKILNKASKDSTLSKLISEMDDKLNSR